MTEPTDKPREPVTRPQNLKAQRDELVRRAVRWSWTEFSKLRRAYDEGARSVDDKSRKE
ncbi:MAG TPA: hypothetical protein VFI22_18610 [Thermomicrobiales bacterium]|nr:hypothetical protein [Thermomicrobiales bacterium]